MAQAHRLISKRRRKEKEVKKASTTEPVRRSLLDILETNLQLAKRVIFIHRVIYIGEHTFAEEEIQTFFKENVEKSNTGYITEPLTGILLSYQRFFCMIVEGSEEILRKHLTLVFNECEDKIKNCKMLMAIHHINGRFSDEFFSYIGKPPERVEQIDPDSDVKNSMRYVQDCCEKLYDFANTYISNTLKAREKAARSTFDIENLNFYEQEVEEQPPDEAAQDKANKYYIKSEEQRDEYQQMLPELKLLAFIVNCRYIKSLEEYYNAFGRITVVENFERKVWPLPYSYVPYNIFDEPYDPIEDLPSKEVAVRPSRLRVEDLVDEAELEAFDV